jgi:hypothetical protein
MFPVSKQRYCWSLAPSCSDPSVTSRLGEPLLLGRAVTGALLDPVARDAAVNRAGVADLGEASYRQRQRPPAATLGSCGAIQLSENHAVHASKAASGSSAKQAMASDSA